MDPKLFDLIFKEVELAVKDPLVKKLKAYLREMMNKPYPDKIPIEQVREEWENFFIFTVDNVMTEAVRAANLTVQKYHNSISLEAH